MNEWANQQIATQGDGNLIATHLNPTVRKHKNYQGSKLTVASSKFAT